MILNFSEMDTKVLEHFYGGEKALTANMQVDENNKILQGMLEPGASIGLHKHENSSEIIYILEGSGKVLYDGKYEKISSGLCHYCENGHEHSLINDSDKNLIFFAVVPNHNPYSK